MAKEQFATKKEVEKILEKKLSEHSKIIVAAVDGILEKRLSGIKNDVKIVETNTRGLKKEMVSMEERLGKKIDNVQTLIDDYVKAQKEFKQEFVILKEEVRQIKNVLKSKLGIEIKAI